MITALLVVIVLILLFGAGVVKGWLANIAGIGCGGILILAALLWLGSFFGENGFTYIVYGIMGVFGLLALAGIAVRADATLPKYDRDAVVPKLPNEEEPLAPAEPEQRDRVWAWFAEDIEQRFTPEARKRARELYDANDVVGLDRFCRGQRNSPYR